MRKNPNNNTVKKVVFKQCFLFPEFSTHKVPYSFHINKDITKGIYFQYLLFEAILEGYFVAILGSYHLCQYGCCIKGDMLTLFSLHFLYYSCTS